MRPRGQAGQALVEFALMFPILFFVLVGMIDLFRIVQVNTTVAEAARQGARQVAANADTGDNPFGPSNPGSCSGTTFTVGAGGSGCLTDGRANATVQQVLGPFGRRTTPFSSSAAGCPNPSVIGTADVCIFPAQTGAAGSYIDCASARSALGREPLPGELGSRQAEWTRPQYKGCFFVQVTVIYTYDPLTPLLGPLAPNLIRLASSTTMLAEY